MSVLIIADDLSGAADCAIGFAGAGLRTVVTLDAARAAVEADVIAADTDTRRLAPAQAAERTASAWRALNVPGRRLYKKIDSTLRGNWAAEVAALRALGGLAIVAPAFPATGRVLRGGKVLVHGVPLEQTDTWKLEHADRPADVAALLAHAGLASEGLGSGALHEGDAALAARIAAAAARGAGALIVDTESEEELRTLARVTLATDVPLFWVGSGGLARELATLVGDAARVLREAEGVQPASIDGYAHAADAPILILVGSLSAVCERQCAMLRERASVNELTVPPQVLRRAAEHADWATWRARIGAALEAGNADLLLRIGRDDAFDPAEGARLSTALAALVAPHFAKAGGLIATGGETARAMLGAAGIGSLQLHEEVEAGVAVCHALDVPGMAGRGIVTKAGAFGTDHALYAAWSYLKRAAQPSPASREQRVPHEI